MIIITLVKYRSYADEKVTKVTFSKIIFVYIKKIIVLKNQQFPLLLLVSKSQLKNFRAYLITVCPSQHQECVAVGLAFAYISKT